MTHALELFKLDGKVALVTGGSRGLGYFAAEALAEAGADVAICGRDQRGKLEEAVEKLSALGRNCIGIKCDISREDDVVEMARQVKQRYGRCDILVNNAGIGGMVPSDQMTTEAWTQMMDVNLKGTFLCCREIGKLMIEQKSGSIINVSSENGQVGFSSGMAAYATTKIGAIGMTRSLAVEWGKHGIRVNAILPGNMQEGMMEMLQNRESPMYKFMGEPLLNLIPLNEFGTGDDMKGATLFLASDAGRYVSGAKIVVDGGFTINAGL
jgi:NAD(P)-dependent dehydrogenase (short-subunit alcohol dehydrogenase family)